jgi:alpha-tubulin suppressor-like RCC1 family protein/ferric-dicitrate binding protein FerR (iron transport regulator)
MNTTRDERAMLEERLIRWEDGELGPEATEGLIRLLREDQSARREFVLHCLLNAGIARELNAGDAENKRPRSMGLGPRLSGRRWVLPLAAAAGLTIAAGGAWWFSQRPADLELRVVAAGGRVAGLRVQGLEGSESGVRGPAGLRVGETLRPGDGIEVGGDGYATLAYPDGTQLELQRNSRLRVTLGTGKNRNAKRLALDEGKMVCDAAAQAKALEISTPHAVARVVGTRFGLDVTEPQSWLGMQEGKVEWVQGGKNLTVTAGKAAVATAGGMESARGVVYAWGGNHGGCLRVGLTNQTVTAPALVLGLDGVKTVAAGAGQMLALKNDGSVWTWGGKREAGKIVSFGPERLAGLSGVTAIAAGHVHSLALKSDGTVWAWGWNHVGQLGDGTTSNSEVPVQAQGLSDVTALAAGGVHSLALKRDGTLWAWGRNESGQLGDGTTNSRPIPVRVKLHDGTQLSGIVAIAAGTSYSVALGKDGNVFAWGGNSRGQCGVPESGNVLWPVQVSGLGLIAAIAVGRDQTVALRQDGAVIGWGNNRGGCLGDPMPDGRCYQPRLADGSALSNVMAIATGYRHSVARKSDGTIWSWGGNKRGVMGDKSAGNGRSLPVKARLPDGSPLSNITAIAAWQTYTLAVGE